jgi:hypothetical protein
MRLTADDLQYLAGHLGLLVGHVRRAPLPFLIATLERRGYDERALAILARLHPHEAHKLVMWSGTQKPEDPFAVMERSREPPNTAS